MQKLPQFEIRKSKRAKYLQLKVGILGQIEVVAPNKVSKSQINHFVLANQSWIDQTRKKISSKRAALNEADGKFPSEIYLPSIKTRWSVKYLSVDASKGILHREEGTNLFIFSKEESHIKSSLRHWLHGLAKDELQNRLNQLSQTTGLTYNRLFIRSQKTRWGSCSRKGNINLNRNLMFFDAKVVDYLVLHELCHTKYFNHSAAFWSLVSQFEPDFRKYDLVLQQGMYKLPWWSIPE